MANDGVDGPARSDARRNRDHLLTAGRAVVAEQGTDASLREVARRAGVGIGTLYRHFPNREALLEALLGQGFDDLTARAAELGDNQDAGAALVTWARELAVGSTLYKGLPASVMDALHNPRSGLHASCEGIRAAAAALLTRAQRAGHIRPDLRPEELLATVSAMAWAAKHADHPDEVTDRFLSLLLEGLSVRR
ncbi:helix-turn-helix domain-containing protein [Actinophytocola sp.]|uniref:TetR/AcrR family transcriptional regulator n=1 Tax=Actinophytocola sp. TaxID=1872138 RepID=UPI002ED89E88